MTQGHSRVVVETAHLLSAGTSLKIWNNLHSRVPEARADHLLMVDV